jgi:HPt (histidine-containing phosphotransfer) domain-containing protein
MSSAEQTKIYSTLAGEEDFAELLQDFVQELGSRQLALLDCFAKGDRGQLIRLIHQMRGSCGGYGFADLTTVEGDIEDQLRSGLTLESLRDPIKDFIDSISRVSASPRS